MDEYNFIKDSKRELEAFYARFFDSNDELQTFLSDAFDYKNNPLQYEDIWSLHEFFHDAVKVLLHFPVRRRTYDTYRSLNQELHKLFYFLP